ncbi:hypothetical protein BDV93DRAFT_265821 [Ceratobasidium sp. AG-I]|nr:hypothetical protein BDV93DRAFT_265821 [Ceratobasidium sp. AG-I]
MGRGLRDKHSLLLLLGYRGGMRAWECSREQVEEVPSLLLPAMCSVIGAAVFLALISLQDDVSHTIVKQTLFNSPHSIHGSERFVVLCTF